MFSLLRKKKKKVLGLIHFINNDYTNKIKLVTLLPLSKENTLILFKIEYRKKITIRCFYLHIRLLNRHPLYERTANGHSDCRALRPFAVFSYSEVRLWRLGCTKEQRMGDATRLATIRCSFIQSRPHYCTALYERTANA